MTMIKSDYDWCEGHAASIVARFFSGHSDFNSVDIRDLLIELQLQHKIAESATEAMEEAWRAVSDISLKDDREP